MLTGDNKVAITKYLRSQYKLVDQTNFKLIKEELLEGTCYRQLTFEGDTAVKKWTIVLYLTPDLRFLTGQLFDITVDPVEEERRKAKLLMSDLAKNKGASQGPDNALVTIVEFSDFECPYCQKFANILNDVLPGEKDRVRVVFHHMPLSMHPWARTAAEGAACAQLQGSEAFWAIHNQIFRHQREITPNNVKQKVSRFRSVSQIPGFEIVPIVCRE